MSSVPTGGSAIKNILIGVVTTVIAYSIFYYFHDLQLAREEKHKKEKATLDAWASLIRYEGISTTGIYAAYCDEDPQDQLENIIYEKNQLVNNYSIISGQENIDPDMKQFLSGAIASTRETVKGLEEFLDALKEAKKTNKDLTLTSDAFQKMNTEFSARLLKDKEKHQRSINETFKILNDKFEGKLMTEADSVHVTEFDLYGKWKELGIAKTMELRSDHSIIMNMEGQDYTGKWSFAGKVLHIEFDDKSEVDFHINDKRDQYFTTTLNKEETVRQYCKL